MINSLTEGFVCISLCMYTKGKALKGESLTICCINIFYKLLFSVIWLFYIAQCYDYNLHLAIWGIPSGLWLGPFHRSFSVDDCDCCFFSLLLWRVSGVNGGLHLFVHTNGEGRGMKGLKNMPPGLGLSIFYFADFTTGGEKPRPIYEHTEEHEEKI